MSCAIGSRRSILGPLFTLLYILALAGCAAAPAVDSSGKFEIGLFGDQHYDADSAAKFPNIMAEMNRADLAFVVHVGDIGAPTYNSCKDETYYQRRDEFNQSRHPLIFTPGDNEWTDCIAPPPKKPSGYADFLAALRREVLAYDRPVVLVHGDTHYFRVDKPLIIDDKSGGGRGRVVEHFTRVELFGYPESHWVRATVDPADPNLFSFRAGMVKPNFADQRAK